MAALRVLYYILIIVSMPYRQFYVVFCPFLKKGAPEFSFSAKIAFRRAVSNRIAFAKSADSRKPAIRALFKSYASCQGCFVVWTGRPVRIASSIIR